MYTPLNDFECSVRETMHEAASLGAWHITDENVRLFAHELLKAAIKQLREDGNEVELNNPID